MKVWYRTWRSAVVLHGDVKKEERFGCIPILIHVFYHGIIIAVTDKTTQQHVAVRIPFIQQHLILGDVIVLLVSIQNVLIDKSSILI